jgi:hypothetical protein
LKYGLNENKTFIFIFKMKRSLRAEKTVAAARDFQILVAAVLFLCTSHSVLVVVMLLQLMRLIAILLLSSDAASSIHIIQ